MRSVFKALQEPRASTIGRGCALSEMKPTTFDRDRPIIFTACNHFCYCISLDYYRTAFCTLSVWTFTSLPEVSKVYFFTRRSHSNSLLTSHCSHHCFEIISCQWSTHACNTVLSIMYLLSGFQQNSRIYTWNSILMLFWATCLLFLVNNPCGILVYHTRVHHMMVSTSSCWVQWILLCFNDITLLQQPPEQLHLL